jgi:glycosyltransferase involved in cell wall biosynthesis
MTKKLKIAQIAPFWFKVPPANYGGTERVVSILTEELVRRGHDVTLFAAPGSTTTAKLVSPIEEKYLKSIKSYNDTNFNDINIYVNAYLYSQAKNFDVIHSHASYFPFFFCDMVKTPTVHTLHNQLPRQREMENELYKKYSHLNFVSISNEFRSHFKLNYIATVYNGLSLETFSFDKEGGDYLIWVGRALKYKGEMAAIEVASKTKEKLNLLMSIRPDAREYVEKKIKPKLNNKIKLMENVKLLDTVRYYKKAKAFIFPLEWREPFGLTMIESMACGTPVIAYDRGSVSEIVKDGETGFVVNPKEGQLGMIKAVQKINSLSETDYLKMRANSRKRVEKYFSIEKMVDDYEQLYYKLLK